MPDLRDTFEHLVGAVDRSARHPGAAAAISSARRRRAAVVVGAAAAVVGIAVAAGTAGGAFERSSPPGPIGHPTEAATLSPDDGTDPDQAVTPSRLDAAAIEAAFEGWLPEVTRDGGPPGLALRLRCPDWLTGGPVPRESSEQTYSAGSGIGLQVTLHRFADEVAARRALSRFYLAQENCTGLQESGGVDVPQAMDARFMTFRGSEAEPAQIAWIAQTGDAIGTLAVTGVQDMPPGNATNEHPLRGTIASVAEALARGAAYDEP